MRLFSVGFSELLVIMMIALVVVGPKDLPKVARWLGKLLRRSRSLIRELRSEFQADGLEDELNDTKREITRLASDTGLKESAHDINEGLRQTEQAAKIKEG